MARPIEPTPPVTGEDAARLLAQLAVVVSPKEMEQRRAAARRHLAQVMQVKTPPLASRSSQAR